LLDIVTSSRTRIAVGILLWLTALGIVADAIILQSGVSQPLRAIDGPVLMGGAIIILAVSLIRQGLKQQRRGGGDTEASLHTDESSPIVGGGFDIALQEARTDQETRKAIQADCHRAVIRTLQMEGATEAEAEELVASGEWTDNERAAAFLSDDVPLDMGIHLQDWLSREHTLDRQVRHTLSALEEVGD
jgi:hypothetical protein